MSADPRAFLSPSKTAEYTRSAMGYALGAAAITGNVASPIFLLAYSEIMRRDHQIEFGASIIMAPLYTVTWTIECDRPEVAKYVDETLHTIWKSLSRMEWLVTYGHMAGESEWEEKDGLIRLAKLKDFHPNDARPLVYRGKLCGVEVRTKDQIARLAPPRAIWMVNKPEAGSFYGRGRLQSAYLPWLEKSGRHGALDIRRSWAVRCAFDGGVMYYPPGGTLLEDGVTVKSNEDTAREILEKKEAGGVLALPNSTKDDGSDKAWEYQPPVINGSFAELLEYPDKLDRDVLKGMSIPPEVVDAAESGSGWSGRSVPFLVFLTSEDQIADTIVETMKRQVIDHGVEVNFGPVEYKIKLNPLAKLAEAPPAGTTPPPTNQTHNAAEESGGGQPHVGPRGEKGVKDPNTGKVRYGASLGEDEPGPAPAVVNVHNHQAPIPVAQLAPVAADTVPASAFARVVEMMGGMIGKLAGRKRKADLSADAAPPATVVHETHNHHTENHFHIPKTEPPVVNLDARQEHHHHNDIVTPVGPPQEVHHHHENTVVVPVPGPVKITRDNAGRATGFKPEGSE